MTDATWIEPINPIRHEISGLRVCGWCMAARMTLLISAAVGSGLIALLLRWPLGG